MIVIGHNRCFMADELSGMGVTGSCLRRAEVFVRSDVSSMRMSDIALALSSASCCAKTQSVAYIVMASIVMALSSASCFSKMHPVAT